MWAPVVNTSSLVASEGRHRRTHAGIVAEDVHEWFLNAAGTECLTIDVYKDSAALLAHMGIHPTRAPHYGARRGQLEPAHSDWRTHSPEHSG